LDDAPHLEGGRRRRCSALRERKCGYSHS
jgi:hypothetical protein